MGGGGGVESKIFSVVEEEIEKHTKWHGHIKSILNGTDIEKHTKWHGHRKALKKKKKWHGHRLVTDSQP